MLDLSFRDILECNYMSRMLSALKMHGRHELKVQTDQTAAVFGKERQQQGEHYLEQLRNRSGVRPAGCSSRHRLKRCPRGDAPERPCLLTLNPWPNTLEPIIRAVAPGTALVPGFSREHAKLPPLARPPAHVPKAVIKVVVKAAAAAALAVQRSRAGQRGRRLAREARHVRVDALRQVQLLRRAQACRRGMGIIHIMQTSWMQSIPQCSCSVVLQPAAATYAW